MHDGNNIIFAMSRINPTMHNEFVVHNDGGSVGDIWDRKI
jgi:hypothetical protein